MYDRYAVYFTAPEPLAARASAWLGWDVDLGQAVPHPAIAGLDLSVLTGTPRKYGFHGTLKAPFRLADGADAAQLETEVAHLAAHLQRAAGDALKVARVGKFLALVPDGDSAGIRALTAEVVRKLDRFRAPMNDAELARRRASSLSPAQDKNLLDWGYPHVMDQFNFHMTLTDRWSDTQLTNVQAGAETYFAPVMSAPCNLDALTLVGQRADGMFVRIKRLPLSWLS